MMKKALLALVATIVCATTSAEPISRQQAQLKAAAFLKQQNPKAILATTAIAKAPRKVNGQAVGDQAYYYVFNTEGNHGFVIASGDDVAIPILAYSDEGSFDEENIPDGLQYMLDGYAKEIAWAQENGISATAPRKAPEGRTSISHLVNAKWGQESPYYNQCPKYGSSYCLTGCVATAMAQVLYYWANQKDYSKTMGSAAIPEYTTATRKLSVTALSAKMPFDWSYMTATRPTTTNEKNAVATLMRYCGQSVQMDYNTSGSGAYNSDIPYALKQYFSLSKAARYLDRYNYTDDEWDEIIYKELEAGRPVIYGGVDANEGGHCFVCDGYDASTGKYYFNWGWSGTSNNTACALSALNTSNGSFNYYQDAIVNVKPQALETEEEVALASNLTLSAFKMVSESNLKRASRTEDCPKVEMQGVVFNYSGMELELETAFQVYNESGELVDVVGNDYESMDAQGGSYYMKSFTFGAEMPYGKYKVYPVCRKEGATDWNLLEEAYDKYVEVELVDNGTDVIVRPAYALKVEVSQTKSGTLLRPTYTTTLNITNVGSETFDGSIFAIVDNNTSNYQAVAVDNLAPGASTSKTVTYNNDIADTSHSLFVTMEGYLPLYINTASPNFGFWNLYWTNSAGDYKLIGDTYGCVVQFTNTGDGDYNGQVSATLFEKGKSESSGETKTFDVTVKPGQINDYELNFSNVSFEKTYSLKIVYNGITFYFGAEGTNNSTTNTYYYPTYAFTMAKGMTLLSEDNGLQRVLDTDELPAIPETTYYVDARYSDKVANIAEGGRTNTVYLLKQGAAVPESLIGKNVVVGATAESISITDDEEFYTPVDFTAQNVSYKRTFESGFNGDEAAPAWSTIMLPFDVENITCEDRQLDWFHSEDDQDKNFWLMDFTTEESGKAVFDYPTTLKANHPYIIAVPAEKWGAANSLVGKEIVFSGQNATFTAGMPEGVVNTQTASAGAALGKYDFIGRTYLTVEPNKYSIMDEAGTQFEYVTDGYAFYAFPFRGYFVAYYDLGEESNVVLSVPAPTPTPATTLLGDVNKDGSVTIADVTALVNIILGKATDDDNYDLAAANVNEDETVSVADVTALVNIILGKTEQAAGAKSVKAVDQKKQTSASGKVLRQAVEHSKGVKALLKGERRTNVNSIKNLSFPLQKNVREKL